MNLWSQGRLYRDSGEVGLQLAAIQGIQRIPKTFARSESTTSDLIKEK